MPQQNGTPATEIAALIARLMSHYWTAADLLATRERQIEDWIDDLIEFPVPMVEEACRQWRQRPGGKRPHPGDIRTLCVGLDHERHEKRLAIEQKNREQEAGYWADWLYELWGPAGTGRVARQAAIAAAEAQYEKAMVRRMAQPSPAENAPTSYAFLEPSERPVAREMPDMLSGGTPGGVKATQQSPDASGGAVDEEGVPWWLRD